MLGYSVWFIFSYKRVCCYRSDSKVPIQVKTSIENSLQQLGITKCCLKNYISAKWLSIVQSTASSNFVSCKNENKKIDILEAFFFEFNLMPFHVFLLSINITIRIAFQFSTAFSMKIYTQANSQFSAETNSNTCYDSFFLVSSVAVGFSKCVFWFGYCFRLYFV